MKKIAFALLLCALWACGNGVGKGDVQFSTSEEINGANPEGAKFAVFGAGAVAPPIDEGVVLLVASDQPDPCSIIGADAGSFLFDMLDGRVAGTWVLVSLVRNGGLPSVGEQVVGDGAGNSVSFSFLVSDGVSLIGLGQNTQGDGGVGVG